MRIPESCSVWKAKMESGERQRRILDNLLRDDCVDEETTNAFFSRLAEKGLPKSAHSAEGFAFQVIEDALDSFVCQGTLVPDNVFVKLFRVERVSDLRYRVPEEFMTAKGVNHREIADSLPDEELQTLTDEYDGPIELGNRIDLVWVTDFGRVEPLLNDLTEILDCLG